MTGLGFGDTHKLQKSLALRRQGAKDRRKNDVIIKIEVSSQQTKKRIQRSEGKTEKKN
jgi:hypothetical protein